MPDLNFSIRGAEAASATVTPALTFKLHLDCPDREAQIQGIMLRCQVRIAVRKRPYSKQEQRRLLDIFGEVSRWNDTLRDMLWTHVNLSVPPFRESITTDLFMPCSYDFEIVSTRYFDALIDGVIPLNFLFNGTIFYTNEQQQLQIQQIPWSKEAHYDLPVSSWQGIMEQFYPNTAWLYIQKDVFERLRQYKATHSLPTWERTLTELLRVSDEHERAHP